MIEVPDQVRRYFRELGIGQVWLLDSGDASEHVYLVSPEDFGAVNPTAFETELIRLLGIKVWLAPFREGVTGHLVYLRDT